MFAVDVVVIGAGAAGMFCAARGGQRGLSVVLVDHAATIGEKIRISGGGRCNFTNLHTAPANFLSQNPHFCRSALARYTPQEFVSLVRAHGIAFHEKHKGQLFCDGSANELITLLREECAKGLVQWRQPMKVKLVRSEVREGEDGFLLGLETPEGQPGGLIWAKQLVGATGGLSIPKIGATDVGYRLAQQFGLRLVPTRPALVPLTFAQWPHAALAGVSCAVQVRTRGPYGEAQFDEDLLFTHRGLSGPAILQISSHWMQAPQTIELNLLPGNALSMGISEARDAKTPMNRAFLAKYLENALSMRLSEAWLAANKLQALSEKRLADLRRSELDALDQAFHHAEISPDGTEGYRKAEVTAGGVDTRDLSSQTMAATAVPGLHFIGEVVDVTGHLGGFNFQWAWASAAAAAAAFVPRQVK
jgi:predicted Rossmann fold flavoprotein